MLVARHDDDDDDDVNVYLLLLVCAYNLYYVFFKISSGWFIGQS